MSESSRPEPSPSAAWPLIVLLFIPGAAALPVVCFGHTVGVLGVCSVPLELEEAAALAVVSVLHVDFVS